MTRSSRVAAGLFGVALVGMVTTAVAADPAAAPAGAATPSAKAAAPKAPKKKAAVSAEQAVREMVSGPEVRNFRGFCDEWMQKLRDRETYNTAHIPWETKDGRVSGEYVGYATDCTCIAREEPGKDPIGKITYRETRYRREGATQAEALVAPGAVVEQSDVTEIFRFGKGRWQY